MRFIILILFISGFTNQYLLAQKNSNEIVISKNGAEMMPYIKGKCTIETFYDKDFTNTIPEHTINLYEEKFNQIIPLLLKHKILNPPIGFEARIEKRIFTWDKESTPGLPNHQNTPKTVSSIEVFWTPYYMVDGKPAFNFNFSTFFQLLINNTFNIAGAPIIADIYPCPQKLEVFHDYEVYATDRKEVTIINFTGKPLFIPVSKEDFINVAITHRQHSIEEEKLHKSNYQENTTEQLVSDDKLKQKKDFEMAYNEMLKYDKAAALELQKIYDQSMNLNLEETNDAKVFDNSVSLAQTEINQLKEELSRMSLSERKRQAIYDVDAFENFNNTSGLVPEKYNDMGDALVRINPDLVTRFPEKVHLVSIQWHLLNHVIGEPRLSIMSADAGLITDNKLLTLYSDSDFWNKIFNMLQN